MKKCIRLAAVAVLAGSAGAGDCTDAEARIDSAPDKNAKVNSCPCFAPGEVAMTILDVPAGEAVFLKEIQVYWVSFFGGQPDSLEAALIVYDMNQAGPADPATFTPLCSEQEGCILEGPVLTDGFLNSYDVSPLLIELPESRFGIGIEFLTDQTMEPPLTTPSVASDDDGHNNAGGVVRNWVLVDGNTWLGSQSLGVSGDWVIRAVVQVCEATEPCPWDFDPPGGDGEVGITEFLILIGSWGTFPGEPPDFDGGGVGITDFLKLLGHWGPCQ